MGLEGPMCSGRVAAQIQHNLINHERDTHERRRSAWVLCCNGSAPMAGEMLPAQEPGCLPLLDAPLLPTRYVLGIPLLLRSDIAGLVSASAALKQLGLPVPGLAGTFVAISGASNGGKVSIRMLAEDGTGALPDRLTATSLRVPIANY